jgi:membrane protease YdiL (CAAX protease family)
MRYSKTLLFGLGLFTIVGFSLLGWLLISVFQGRELGEVLTDRYRSYPLQMRDGLLYGAVASMNILWLLYHAILEAPRNFFTQLIKRFRINLFDVFFLSICAGVGEEMLFRGAIQHWLGIWITAILFIALHGYLDPRDWRISLYGLLMVVIVAGLGYLFERSGLVAAMTAHAVIDIAIFISLKYFNRHGQAR